MNYLIISIVAILILALFVAILLINSKTSSSVSLEGKTLTVGYPLKQDVIDLEKDLRSWNLRRMNLMWRGKLYALSLELQDGAWKKIYFRSRTQKKIRPLVSMLNELAPTGKIEPQHDSATVKS